MFPVGQGDGLLPGGRGLDFITGSLLENGEQRLELFLAVNNENLHGRGSVTCPGGSKAEGSS